MICVSLTEDTESSGSNSFDVSKVKSWQQVVASIVIIGIGGIVAFLKPETALYITIIVLALVGLMFYIVKRATISSHDMMSGSMVQGHKEGLKVLMDDLNNKKDESNNQHECECYQKMISAIKSRLDIYESLIPRKAQ